MGDGVIEILLEKEISNERDPKVKEGLQRALDIVRNSGYYNLEDLEDNEYEDEIFWDTEVSTADQVQDVIQHAIEEGCTYDDINDYLTVLVDEGKMTEEGMSYFLDWVNFNFKF